jgi:hypothetical protein
VGQTLLSPLSLQQDESETPANPYKLRRTLRQRKGGFTMAMLNGWNYDGLTHQKYSWADAVAANDQTYISAVVAAAPRLLLWHWMQPVLYWKVLYCTWSDIDGLQAVFGVAVAMREAGYVIATLICMKVNPAFLLVDVVASVKDATDGGANSGLAFLLTYAFAPEKFVLMAALGRGGLKLRGFEAVAGLHLQDIYLRADKRTFFCSVLLMLFDLCGMCALVIGVLRQQPMPHALAVGYCATAMGALCLVALSCCVSQGAPATGLEVEVGVSAQRQLMLENVKHNTLARLQNASVERRADRQLILTAVNQTGLALQYASSDLQADREVVILAVGQNWQALKFASIELKGDCELVEFAMQQDSRAFGYASKGLQRDRDGELYKWWDESHPPSTIWEGGGGGRGSGDGAEAQFESTRARSSI